MKWRLLFICTIVFAFPAAALAAAGASLGSCAVHLDGATIPAGYAVPHDVFSTAKNLLLDGACSGGEVRFRAGDITTATKRMDQYVYKTGYAYYSGKWNTFTFGGLPGSLTHSAWIQGAAEKVVNAGTSQLASGLYSVAYVCTWRDPEWKCGCKDATCGGGPAWQLQVFRSEDGQSLGAAGINAAATRAYIEDMEEEIFTRMNLERTNRGLAALIFDERLQPIARGHSKDMVQRNFFGHPNPDGCNPQCRVNAAGYAYRLIAENLYTLFNNAGITVAAGSASTVSGWLNSPAHRDIMLSPDLTHSALGVAVSGDEFFATALYSVPQ